MADFTESFDKADGSGLGPDLTWSLTGTNWATEGGQGVITGTTTSFGEIAARAEHDTGSADMFVELTLPDFGISSYADVGLCVRMSADRQTFYCLKRTTTRQYEIRRYVNNVLTVLVDENLSFTLPETWRFEVEGNQLRAYRNGILIDSVSDSQITTGSFGGLNGYRNNTASSRRVIFDDFTVGDLADDEPPAGVDLDVSDAGHAHASDEPSLTQTHALDVEGATHAHTADVTDVTQTHTLTVGSAQHAHSVDAPTLTQAHALDVSDASHAHASGEPSLTQTHDLDVSDASHAHASDEPSLTQAHDLDVADGFHGHTADTASGFGQYVNLSVSDATHGHVADAPELAQAHGLDVAYASHAHTADEIAVEAGTVALTVGDATHTHGVDAPTLTQAHALEVVDAQHGHAAAAVTLDADVHIGAIIVGAVTGPRVVATTVTGPSLRRDVDGPVTVTESVTGPRGSTVTVDGPDTSRIVDGPDTATTSTPTTAATRRVAMTGPSAARTVTGPGV